MSGPKLKTWNYIRRVFPAVVSAALLYYYFRQVDWPKIIEAAKGANILLLVAGRTVPIFLYWWLGAQVTQRLILWFHKPVPLRDVIWARGALSLLLLVNMAVSTGGFFLYLMRKTGIGAARLTGLYLFEICIVIWGFVIIFTPAAVYISLQPQSSLWLTSPPLLWLLVGTGWFWMFHWWTFWRRGWSWGRLSIILRRKWDVWHVFSNADTMHWLKTFTYVIPPNLLSFAGYYLCALAFDVHIPAAEFFLLIPLVTMVSALPVAFGGFGTTTAAWLYFFPQYADRETYLAMTVVLPVITCLSRALVGLISLKPAYREWDRIISHRLEEP